MIFYLCTIITSFAKFSKIILAGKNNLQYMYIPNLQNNPYRCKLKLKINDIDIPIKKESLVPFQNTFLIKLDVLNLPNSIYEANLNVRMTDMYSSIPDHLHDLKRFQVIIVNGEIIGVNEKNFN